MAESAGLLSATFAQWGKQWVVAADGPLRHTPAQHNAGAMAATCHAMAGFYRMLGL